MAYEKEQILIINITTPRTHKRTLKPSKPSYFVMVHGINDPACDYNYIATSVVVPDTDVYICSLRNVSQLAIITYQQGI